MYINKIPSPLLGTLYLTLTLFSIESFLPFESLVESTLFSKIILICFYLILFILVKNFKPKKLHTKKIRIPNNKVFNYLRILAFIGPFFILIDRIFIRGLDINIGIAAMRTLMENNSTGGVSSVFSVFGYLACAMSFILITRLVIFPKSQTLKRNYLDVFLIFFSIIGVSLLTGGRTALFLLVGFTYSSFYCRINLLKQGVTIKFKSLLIVFIIFFSLLIYVTYVFQQRAITNDIEAKDYYTSIINHLHGKQKPGANLSNKGDLYIYSQLTLAYFVHQYWIMEESLNLPNKFRVGDSTFVGWKNILSKTKLVDKPIEWYFSGFYIPLLGVFLYKYGTFFGFFYCLSFLFFLYIIPKYNLIKRPSFDWFVLYNYSSFVILFSTVLPSSEIMMSPIFILGFLFLYPIIKYISRFRLK